MALIAHLVLCVCLARGLAASVEPADAIIDAAVDVASDEIDVTEELSTPIGLFLTDFLVRVDVQADADDTGPRLRLTKVHRILRRRGVRALRIEATLSPGEQRCQLDLVDDTTKHLDIQCGERKWQLNRKPASARRHDRQLDAAEAPEAAVALEAVAEAAAEAAADPSITRITPWSQLEPVRTEPAAVPVPTVQAAAPRRPAAPQPTPLPDVTVTGDELFQLQVKINDILLQIEREHSLRVTINRLLATRRTRGAQPQYVVQAEMAVPPSANIACSMLIVEDAQRARRDATLTCDQRSYHVMRTNAPRARW